MIEAVLFDLDGTLLINDMERFMSRYLNALGARVNRVLPASHFIDCLMAATNEMVLNKDPEVTNERAFQFAFDKLSQRTLDELRPIIDQFYAHDFAKLADCTQRRPEARSLVETVVAKGRLAVLATNPLFPLTAIQQRMAWAGVEDLPFALITSYENMHYSKPHKEYFVEIADQLGVPTERCLMVGDDLIMDQPAAEAGMRFFCVSDRRPFGAERGDLAHLHAQILDGLLDS